MEAVQLEVTKFGLGLQFLGDVLMIMAQYNGI